MIGGLHDDHVYGVIVVDANTLRLGSTFLAASADADSLDGAGQRRRREPLDGALLRRTTSRPATP